jgi:hypothetical protein
MSDDAFPITDRLPQQMPDKFQLSDSQRDKLFDFIQWYSDATFRRDESFDDMALVALALKTAQLWGMESEISGFFEREFGIKDVSDDIDPCRWLSMLIDSERQLQARCGGRN